MIYPNFKTLNLLKINELYFCHVLREEVHRKTLSDLCVNLRGLCGKKTIKPLRAQRIST